MDQNLTDLARALVACPQFRWLPGMYASEQYSVEGETEYGRVVYIDGDGWPRFAGDEYASFPGECCPIDLADPATVGCLFALLERSLVDFNFAPPFDDAADWTCWVFRDEGAIPHAGATLGEAVARALLDVWGAGR